MENTLCSGKFVLFTTYATCALRDLGIEAEVNEFWGNDETPLMEIAVSTEFVRDYLRESLEEAQANGKPMVLSPDDETVSDTDIEKYLNRSIYDDLEGLAEVATAENRFAFARLISAKLPDGADDLFYHPDHSDMNESDILDCFYAVEEYLRADPPHLGKDSLKLTKQDKKYLLSIGEDQESVPQIEEAANTKNTTYEICGQPINREVAIMILGRESWLAGLARSAFHGSAVQYTETNEEVHFDSSAFLRGAKE